MLVELALISILVVLAQLLRARVPWAGRYLIPTSMIAGVLGLIALNVLSFSSATDAAGQMQVALAKYPGVLITLVFATLLMGFRAKGEGPKLSHADVRVSFLYNMGAEIGQYGLAILFGVFVLAVLFPGLPQNFAVMLPGGFAGGHGTSAIFGQAFQKDGWHDALSVGFAFATLGLLASMIGGMLLINIAIRCGWTSFISASASRAAQEEPAFLKSEQQFPIGMSTSNPTALDPLLWHVALLGAVYGLTLGIDVVIHRAIPGDYWLPQFAIAMLLGALVQFALNAIHVGKFVDRATMRRLGSLCADTLVVCGVASIKPAVVWQYAGPIALMTAFGVMFSVGFLFLGPWIFREHWFERSIFTYGWLTGVVGFSVALLRVVDPRLKSNTLEDYGAAYMLIGPVELVLYPAIIWACASGAHVALGLTLTLIAVALILAARWVPLPLGVEKIKPNVATDVAGGQPV